MVLASLVLWALNDHVFKGAFHNELTGKLSDVTSLIVFPLLPVAVHDLWLGRGPRSHNAWLIGWVIATGFVMATINVFDTAAEAYRVGLAVLQYPFLAIMRGELGPLHRVQLTMDPTDLFTLPALIVPLRLGWISPPAPERDGESARFRPLPLRPGARAGRRRGAPA